MPLTPKGRRILEEMKSEFGPEKGREVFYASANKGTITGVHEKSTGGKHGDGKSKSPKRARSKQKGS
jgi:hypothetical protein